MLSNRVSMITRRFRPMTTTATLLFLSLAALGLFAPGAQAQNGCNPPSVFATPILYSPGNCPLVVDYIAPLYSNGSISAVAVADFNGDGKMDVVMALNGGNANYGVAVLLGNGDGTFSSPIFSAPCCSPDLRGENWVAVGDFNGDGKPDIAVGTQDGYAAILLGNGDGTFTLKSYWTVTACCSGPQAGAVGDFNGDGHLDLLVATAPGTSPGYVYLFPGNGDGTFNTNNPSVVAVGDSSNHPTSITVGDFNHDGHLDFATVNNSGGTNNISVVLGNGNGTLQPAVNYALFNPSRGDSVTDSVSIVAGDFNHDGYLDLATLDKLNSGVSVLLNNGDGTFKAPVVYGSAATWNNSSHPQQIAVGDFNNDGNLDIVYMANQQGAAGVLFGNGDGTFKPAVTYVTDVNPVTVAVADFNGDGIADFVVGTEYNDGVTIALSKGDGSFKGARSYVPWIVSNSYYGWGNGGPNPASVALGDFNGDGKPDLAVADGNNVNVTIFANNGDGSFTESANYRTTLTQYAFQPTLVRVADLNKDGKLDLVVGGGGDGFETMLGVGDGTFQAPILYSSGYANGLGKATTLAIADVNGDGIADVIFNSTGGYFPPQSQLQAAYVALGNGDGTFQTPIATSAFCAPWGGLIYVAVADLNGDGKPDLAAACGPDGNNNRPTTIFVLLGNGDGTFGAASAVAANAFPTIIAAGDFNEDGKQDLVVGNNYPAPAQFSVLLGNGDGTFQNPVAYSVLPSWWTSPSPTPWPQTFAVADFNHDGHLDVLVGGRNGTVGDSATGDSYNQGVQLLLGNGDGTLQAPQLFLAGRYAYDMAVADINGDGTPDVAIADGVDSAVTILLNQTSVDQAPAITSANSTTFTVGAAGSFTVTATGYPAPTLSESGTLPNGVTFDSSTGVLSGTPAGGTGGTYPITFIASNGVGNNATQNFTLTVDQAAAITSANSTTFTVGAAGSFTVTATGYPSPTLSESGALPNGVTFNASTGVLSGTPAAGTSGTYPITFSASNGIGSNATQNFTLTVDLAPAITSANNATFTAASFGLFTVTATGYPAPTLSENGALPSGVTFDASTGVLSGTPAAGTGGVYNISFTASNGVGTNAVQNFTLTVRDFSLTESPASVTIPPPHNAKYTLTIAPIYGFTGIVNLSCRSTVVNSTCTVKPSYVTLGGSTAATATVTPPRKAPTGTYQVTFTATSGGLTHTATATLILTQ